MTWRWPLRRSEDTNGSSKKLTKTRLEAQPQGGARRNQAGPQLEKNCKALARPLRLMLQNGNKIKHCMWPPLGKSARTKTIANRADPKRNQTLTNKKNVFGQKHPTEEWRAEAAPCRTAPARATRRTSHRKGRRRIQPWMRRLNQTAPPPPHPSSQ